MFITAIQPIKFYYKQNSTHIHNIQLLALFSLAHNKNSPFKFLFSPPSKELPLPSLTYSNDLSPLPTWDKPL